MKRKICRPPTGNKIIFKNEYKTLLEASKGSKKQFYFFSGINLNLLGYWTNKYGKTIFSFSFKTSIFPSIARPTRVTHTTATAINHILRRNFVTKYLFRYCTNWYFWSFPYFYFCRWRDCYELNHKKETLFEREINERSKEAFENTLNNCSWDIASNETNPDIV